VRVEQHAQHGNNFSKRNLKGRSFKGLDLSNADFSGADIRGADFTYAILRGANFTNAKAGLEPQWVLLLFGILMVLAILLGVWTGFVGGLVELKFRTSTIGFQQVTGEWVTGFVLIAFAITAIHSGIAAGFGVFVAAFIVAIALALTVPAIAATVNPIAVAIAAAIATVITINFSIVLTSTAIVVLAFAAFMAFGIGEAAIAVSAFLLAFTYTVAIATATTYTVAIVPIVMGFSTYITHRALRGDERDAVIRAILDSLTTRWGTSFRGADLTGADFTKAALKNTDFSESILLHARRGGRAKTEAGYNPTDSKSSLQRY
jgi:hypothetical protein